MTERDPAPAGKLPKFVTQMIPRERITRVHLVRHGEVSREWHDRIYGQLDVPLSTAGQAQAEALGRRMDAMPIDAVYASDLSRAFDTASALARPHGLPVKAVRAFREASFGHWQGQSWAEILERHGDEVRARSADFGGAKMKDGESLVELAARVLPALREIVMRHQGESVIVATHGGVTRVILADALGMNYSACARIEQSHCCLNTLDYLPERAYVRLING